MKQKPKTTKGVGLASVDVDREQYLKRKSGGKSVICSHLVIPSVAMS